MHSLYQHTHTNTHTQTRIHMPHCHSMHSLYQHAHTYTAHCDPMRSLYHLTHTHTHTHRHTAHCDSRHSLYQHTHTSHCYSFFRLYNTHIHTHRNTHTPLHVTQFTAYISTYTHGSVALNAQQLLAHREKYTQLVHCESMHNLSQHTHTHTHTLFPVSTVQVTAAHPMRAMSVQPVTTVQLEAGLGTRTHVLLGPLTPTPGCPV